MAVSKRTILITGCSEGSLGSFLATAFHKAGWRVFASARTMSKLKQTQAAGIETVLLDTTSDESITSCVSRIEELTGGSLDTLLNNAGTGYSMPLMDLDLADARHLFDVNVFSIISMTRAFLPLLMKSTHGGMVVNNTSCSSLTAGGLPFAGAYNSSKAAATSITEVLRLELEPFGVKVINMMTGSVKSTFYDNTVQNTLPATSMYNVAKEAVEKAMAGEDYMTTSTDPVKWAAQIVKDLSKSAPPYWIWGGKYSTLMRIVTFLPIGALDGLIKAKVGLDVVERKIKEQRVSKVKQFNVVSKSS
jgi:1-acylglycerone phosphate reductase